MYLLIRFVLVVRIHGHSNRIPHKLFKVLSLAQKLNELIVSLGANTPLQKIDAQKLFHFFLI